MNYIPSSDGGQGAAANVGSSGINPATSGIYIPGTGYIPAGPTGAAYMTSGGAMQYSVAPPQPQHAVPPMWMPQMMMAPGTAAPPPGNVVVQRDANGQPVYYMMPYSAPPQYYSPQPQPQPQQPQPQPQPQPQLPQQQPPPQQQPQQQPQPMMAMAPGAHVQQGAPMGTPPAMPPPSPSPSQHSAAAATKPPPPLPPPSPPPAPQGKAPPPPPSPPGAAEAPSEAPQGGRTAASVSELNDALSANLMNGQMIFIMPNSVLPEGRPFCPAGVPPLPGYASPSSKRRGTTRAGAADDAGGGGSSTANFTAPVNTTEHGPLLKEALMRFIDSQSGCTIVLADFCRYLSASNDSLLRECASPDLVELVVTKELSSYFSFIYPTEDKHKNPISPDKIKPSKVRIVLKRRDAKKGASSKA